MTKTKDSPVKLTDEQKVETRRRLMAIAKLIVTNHGMTFAELSKLVDKECGR